MDVHKTPYVDDLVTTLPAVVTAVATSGFYLEDEDANWDGPTLSCGIFIETASEPFVEVGDRVIVCGRVRERRENDSDLSTTVIDSTVTEGYVTRTASGVTLPSPVVLGYGGRTVPTTIIEDNYPGNVENGASLDLTEGIDFYESLEGMRVQINDAIVVGPLKGTGKSSRAVVLPDLGAWASPLSAYGGMMRTASDANPERVMIDSWLLEDALPAVNVGDTFDAPLVGVLGYKDGNFRLHLTSMPRRVDNGLAAEAVAAITANQLRVGTFNVHGLSVQNTTAEYDALASIIVTNLKSPDLLLLEEVQDNSASATAGIVTANGTLAKLGAAVVRAGGAQYAWRQVDPVNNADGGEFNGNIRSVFFFRTDRGLSFIDRPSLSDLATTGTAAESGPNGLQLSISPGRIDPGNSAWMESRKPLAGEFVFQPIGATTGRRLFVIGCHFVSKVDDSPLFGRWQPPLEPSASQRAAQATVVANFVGELLAVDVDARIIVLGDFNDFEWSTPMATLEAAGLDCLTDSLDANQRYTFVEDGNSQAIDHVLISNVLAGDTPVLDIVHVNAEYAVQASDHDPVLLRLFA